MARIDGKSGAVPRFVTVNPASFEQLQKYFPALITWPQSTWFRVTEEPNEAGIILIADPVHPDDGEIALSKDDFAWV